MSKFKGLKDTLTDKIKYLSSRENIDPDQLNELKVLNQVLKTILNHELGKSRVEIQRDGLEFRRKNLKIKKG